MSPEDVCLWCGHPLTFNEPEYGKVLVDCGFCGWADEIDEDDIS